MMSERERFEEWLSQFDPDNRTTVMVTPFEAWQARADLTAERDREADIIHQSVREATSDESLGGDCGYWDSCTGCHETVDGAETGHYPYSKTFQCHLGAGCNECGGLGAVWHYWTERQLCAMKRDALTAHESQNARSGDEK